MVEIYTDMVLLDAVNRSVSKKFKSYNLEPSEHIYNKYKIDSTTLADNMGYYNLEFETNAEIYKKVSENIEERKTYTDSVVQLKDSLKKIGSACSHWATIYVEAPLGPQDNQWNYTYKKRENTNFDPK